MLQCVPEQHSGHGNFPNEMKSEERVWKNMDTEESRAFWESFPKRDESKKAEALPSIGEAWWEAEKELSLSLLSIKE